MPTAYPVAYPVANPVAGQGGPGIPGLIAGGRQVAGAQSVTGLQAMGAGGGPMGMAVAGAVDAGTGILKSAFERMRGMFEDAGKGVKAVFANDGFALFQTGIDQAAKGLEAIPVAGGLASGALRTLVAPVGFLKTALEAMNGRAHELAGYSGEIATAVAAAKTSRMLADIQEGQQMGGRYAKMVLAQENIERKIQELLMPIKEVLIDTLSDVIDILRAILPSMRAAGEAAEGSRSLLRDILDAIPPDWKKLLDEVRGKREREEEQARGSGLDDVGELLRGIPQIPAPGLNPQFQQAMANNQIPVFLQPGRR